MSAFTTSDVTITKPNAQAVSATSIQNAGLNRYRISFPAQTLVGIYHAQIGPNIADLAGNLLDQDRDGTFGEAADVYDAYFNLVPVDLGLNSINVSPTTLVAGESLTVTWSGVNQTGAQLVGDWTDAVYLSKDDRWDINDILLATVMHTGGLAAGQPYIGSATVILPGALPGNYRIVVRADVANQERETNEANNVAVSSPVALVVRPLVSGGTPANGTLTPADRADYFAIHVNGGDNLGLVLDGLAASGVNELYASFEAIPTRLSYDYRSVTDETFFNRLDQQIAFTGPPGGGTLYILVYGDQINGQSPYTLAATTGSFVVTSITPDRSTNRPPEPANGTARPIGRIVPTTVSITGAGFNDATRVDFIGTGGVVFPATSTRLVSSTILALDLDVTTWPAGVYGVRITKGTTAFTKPGAFTVVAGGKAQLETSMIVPEGIASTARAPQTLWIEYRNTGNAPMPAPLLKVSAISTANARITADRSLAYPFSGYENLSPAVTDTVQLMAIGSGGTPGILQPGDSGRIPVYYFGLDTFGHFNVTFSLSSLTADDVSWSRTTTSSARVERPPGSGNWVIITTTTTVGEDWHVNWTGAATQPESIAPDAWNAVASNLNAMIGTEWGDYVVALADDANALHALGQDTRDVGTLYGFEVAQASASLNPVSYLAGSVDESVPTPGLPLSFSRVFGQPITSRYKLGSLGRGWSTNWDVRAEVQSNGDVVLRGPGGVDRFFTKQKNGGYTPSIGDFASLVLAAGAYKLTETDQTVWQFRAEGKLDFVADPNGNRITPGYDGLGRLIKLTHSNGSQLRLEYNAAGRIARVVNPLGAGTADDLVTIYEYDASGEHLMRVTAPGDRITDYAYDTGTNPARRHALLEVAYPDGTHDHYDYDSLGRLAETSADDDAQRLTFAYDSTGGVTVTDATGRTTRLYYGLNGRLEQVRDGDGRIVDFVNCSCGHLRELLGPSGERYNYDYDDQGNLTGIRDPLRQNVTFTYDPTFNQVASVTDARGNGMTYGYDARGNLASITYADGSHEDYTYDASGNVITATNRRGQKVTYTYNTAGQVLTKDYPGTTGIDFTYRYDTAGNLILATDPSGTTTMAYDPATNLLTRIDYPGGPFFTFAYDSAGRRTRRTDQDGHVEATTYDVAGRIDTMRDEHDALIVHYEYDAAGRLSRKTLGNGVYTTYDYDASGHVLHLVNQRANGTILSRFDYTYDTSGRRTSMATLDDTQTYGYDPLGQLTSVTYANGRVVTYAYDAAGNRTTVTDDGVATDYTTNNLNQYTTVGGATYTYDTDGNQKAKTENGVTTTYTYDVENRLIDVMTPTDTWAYRYDAFGQRIWSSHNGEATRYVIDPTGLGNLAAEYDGNGKLVARYDHGIGLVSRFDAVGDAGYYTFQAIGHTSEITGTSGLVLNLYEFDPFGVTLSKSEAVANPFAYVGEYGVMAVGGDLEFMRSRFYDPNTGRFTQADPIGINGGGANLYAYTTNQPVAFVDPSGTRWTWRCGDASFSEGLSLSFGLTIGRFAGFSASVGPEASTPQLSWPTAYISYFGVGVGASVGATVGLGLGVTEGFFCGWEWQPDPRPPDPPPGPEKRHTTTTRISGDPNDKLAPSGYGEAAYIPSDNILAYQIRFENKADATAPAQEITITDTLDADLELDTLQLTEITFADQSIAVPIGLNHYETTVPFTANGHSILVDVRSSLDRATRTLTLNLRALDPATGWFPEDPLTGFLYPNDATGRAGFVQLYRQAKGRPPLGHPHREPRGSSSTSTTRSTPPSFTTPSTPPPRRAPWPPCPRPPANPRSPSPGRGRTRRPAPASPATTSTSPSTAAHTPSSSPRRRRHPRHSRSSPATLTPSTPSPPTTLATSRPLPPPRTP
ncbi:MAG: RHS repeat-associated core domain-containing protein [Isosphaeraceae bacterium]